MAQSTYIQAAELISLSEGGYSNHKKDPGGPTNYGITQATYDAWRKEHRQPKRSVRYITLEDVSDILKTNYADMIRYEDLPAGVDYALLDFAFNSGVSRAVRYIQRIVGERADGVMGTKTLSAIKQYPPKVLINKLCDARLAYMKRLRAWKTFGKGWTIRVEAVRENAIAFVEGAHIEPSPQAKQGKAHGGETLQSAIKEVVENPTAIGAVVAQASGVFAAFQGDGPIHWAIAALILIGGLILIAKLVRDGD